MKSIELFCFLAALATLTSAVEIQCIFTIGSGTIGFTPYTCWAFVIDMGNSTAVTEIGGYHLEGRNNGHVRVFEMSNQDSIATIPEGIENFFANLERFIWWNGNISSIDSSTFEPFKNLLILELGGNKIVSLDGDILKHTRNLREIYFDSNLLEHVGHDLLTGLTDLVRVDFRRNPCINKQATTPLRIEELNLQLPIQCPPLATTPDPSTTIISTTSEPNECPDTCTINAEAQEMRIRIEEIERRLRELE